MADINAIRQQMQSLINPAYDQQKKALTNQFNTQLAQLNRDKAAIPGQYTENRNAVALRTANSQNSLSDYLSNAGYGSGGGYGASKLVDINNQNQKSMDTIGKEQASAIQKAVDNINNSRASYNTNYTNLSSQASKDIASATQTAYQSALQREYEAQEAEKSRQAQLQLQRESEAFQARQSALSRAASASSSSSSSSEKAVSNGVAQTIKYLYRNDKDRGYVPNVSGDNIIGYVKNLSGGDGNVAASILSQLPTSVRLYSPNGQSTVVTNMGDYYMRSRQGWSSNKPK